MPTLIAVIKDLWNFCFKNDSKSQTPETKVSKLFSEPIVDLSKNELEHKSIIENKKISIPNDTYATYGEKFYVLCNQANVFLRPVWSFDGVLLRLPYASVVQVLGYEGRFARVSVADKSGFILKDDLTVNQADIFPRLQVGEIYSSNHPDTKKIRKIIKDEFFTSEMFLPLQTVEFVSFRLQVEGRNIIWPDVRPRLAGSWQNILKGQIGVQIGVLPKTGAIIEYTKPDGTGFIGYTKSVHVDESIIVQGVGRLIEGEYREEAISKEEWQEWRPVWIQIQ